MTLIRTVDMDHRHVASLIAGVDDELTAALSPIVPLDAPDMPLAGPDFLKHAIQLGDDETVIATAQKKKQNYTSDRLAALCRYALYSPKFKMPVSTKNGVKPADFLPGHLIKNVAENYIPGPKPARVMVVFRNPCAEDIRCRDVLGSEHMQPFFEALAACEIPEATYNDWYVTTLCKFQAPVDTTSLPATWIKDCEWLIEQEIRLVAPDYILCFGAEATKSVLNIRGAVSNLTGREMTIQKYDCAGNVRQIKVMSMPSPVTVFKKQDMLPDFISNMQRFKNMISASSSSERVDYADIYTEDDLRRTVDEMIADPDKNSNIIAVDCEWHGEYPTESGAYLRTIQISNKHGWARNIVLRHQGGAEAFKPDLAAAQAQLNRLLKSTPERHVRVGGHFLRADLPWLIDFGVDVRDEYAPAPDSEDRSRGGWDTSLLYHAVTETARFGLDVCSMRFTSAPIYWSELDDWLKKQKKSDANGGGYGDVPAHILHRYGAYDADVTRRIMLYFYGTDGTDGAMAEDQYGHDCWRPYWIAHSSSLAFLEMELTGLVVDRQRADELTTLFMNTQERLLAEIRDELGWPDFNPKSQPQLAVALFGASFLNRFTNPPALPDTLNTLNLTPVKTTGKRTVLWSEISRRGITKEAAVPSTDKETLGILGYQHPTAAKIRDYKFISQVLQSVLRRPNVTDDGDFETDDNDNYVYKKGLVGCAHADGRVRTHFFQTKETGRASSARPPLQNLSSRREDDYIRIIGEQHRHPVRSILRVPEGYVGIETDLTGAELAVLAWLSQDQNMIDHVRRNLLPDTHPDHYDIHSRQAVKTFGLTGIEPTSKAMKNAGKKGLRVAAKNVNFGIPYGRGAEALSRQCKEEGHDVTQQECQMMIDAYFDSYPGVAPFLQECRTRSQNPGWIEGPYGRFRRFIKSKDRAIRSEQERQAQNFPIQGAVADAVSIALNNFYQYRLSHPDIDYKIGLQIHDAIVLIVPIEHAERVYKEVVPACMVNSVPFYPKKLDGTPIDAGPYYFGSSREVFVHWGELLTADEADALGLRFLAEELAS